VKRKTQNAQRPTANVEFGRWHVAEISDGEHVPTSKRVYDLEDRLLEFAANIVQLTESLPNTRAENHIAGQLLRYGTSALSNHGELKRQNHAGISFINFEFVSRNYAKQNAGYDW
jgi:hypothetical protein